MEAPETEYLISHEHDATKKYTAVPLGVRLLIEFLGTLMFVFFGAGTASHFGNQDTTLPVLELTAVSAAHGVITMVLIYEFAQVSGAFFNAGPTLFAFITGHLPVLDTAGYLIAQAAGAMAGACMLLPFYGWHHHLGTPALGTTTWLNESAVPPLQIRNVPWYGGLLAEIYGTFFLSMAAVLSSRNKVPQQALVIGATLFCIFLVLAPIDGSAMNTWRWLGPAVVSRQFASYWWIYVVGPNVGFVLGGLLSWFHMKQAPEHHHFE